MSSWNHRHPNIKISMKFFLKNLNCIINVLVPATSTWKWHSALFLPVSATSHVTSVWPIGKAFPEGGSQVATRSSPELSQTIGSSHSTKAVWSPKLVFTDLYSLQVICGSSVSAMHLWMNFQKNLGFFCLFFHYVLVERLTLKRLLLILDVYWSDLVLIEVCCKNVRTLYSFRGDSHAHFRINPFD